MDFDFNINNIFPEEISLIGKWHGDDGSNKGVSWNRRDHEKVRTVIDELGKRSAKAQNLPCQITSLTRAEYNRHRIYLLKDKCSNNGHGSALGFIKVGRKQLFLLDCDGNQNELSPLCVLDFYVHESKQRQGCGLRLFRYMLREEKVAAVYELAIDKPSHKFLSFLRKHFNLNDVVPQVNNFVVFDKFFDSHPTTNSRYHRSSSRGRDYFRPLSRATSDIGRNNRRQSPQHNHRPFSHTEVTTTTTNPLFPRRNVRRRKWDQSNNNMWGDGGSSEVATNNRYSRYSHHNNGGYVITPVALPPVPQIQRFSPNNTDMNSKNHHQEAKKENNNHRNSPVVMSPQKERPSSRLSISRDVGRHSRPPSSGKNNVIPNGGGAVQQPHPKPPLVPHPPAKKTFASNTTSDIILEMQKKDRLALLSAQQNSFYNKHKKLNGTSNTAWNLFGVPTIPTWYK